MPPSISLWTSVDIRIIITDFMWFQLNSIDFHNISLTVFVKRISLAACRCLCVVVVVFDYVIHSFSLDHVVIYVIDAWAVLGWSVVVGSYGTFEKRVDPMTCLRLIFDQNEFGCSIIWFSTQKFGGDSGIEDIPFSKPKKRLSPHRFFAKAKRHTGRFRASVHKLTRRGDTKPTMDMCCPIK